MDPLSLLANVIAVVDAVTTVAKRLETLRSFRGAPDQLLQVIKDRPLASFGEDVCSHSIRHPTKYAQGPKLPPGEGSKN